MKIVFMGTPDFSAAVLERLHKSYPVSVAVTSPDKPTGRGYKTQPSPLKVMAESLNIPVLQFAKVSKEGIDDIKSLKPDIVVTAAFGQILSEEFLNIPKYGVLNVHASLLPKYRGSSPIQHAILNDENETGVTIMRTVKAVDAGDILLAKKLEIGKNETAGELFDRLAVLGGEAIVEAISLLESGKAAFVPQNESEATHCSMISKADGKIDFDKFTSASEIDRFVRAMTPWPSAYTTVGGKTLKVYKTQAIDGMEDMMYILAGYSNKLRLQFEPDMIKQNGTVVSADSEMGLVIAGNGYLLRLKEIQLEGSRRMTDVEFLNGHPIALGTVLGK